jgi:outer membrane protein assembly factor BamB
MVSEAFTDSAVWRTAGGDNARRGLFPRAVQIRPRPVRRLPAAGAVQASVVFDAQGTAFVADMAGAVQAFAPGGKRRWLVRLPGGISATPVVHPVRPRLLVGTHAGWVYALDTATGATVWKTEVPTKSDPRILSDLLCLPQADGVVLSSWGGRFLVLDATSGATKFSWDAGISPYAAASADQDGNLYCLRAVWERGVELVRITLTGDEAVLHGAAEGKRGARRTLVAAAPLLDESRARLYFVVNQDEGSLLCAWSLKTAALLWSQPLPGAVQATPTLRHDGAVLLADLRGSLHALHPDGTRLFRYDAGCDYFLAGSVCEAGGASFLGDPLGRLHVVGPQGKGKPVFEAGRSLQARPSFAPDGTLHLPATDRTVWVFPAKPLAQA